MIQTISIALQVFARAALVDANKLAVVQHKCDLLIAESLLQGAFATDVRPAIQDWRTSTVCQRIRPARFAKAIISNESPKIAPREIRAMFRRMRNYIFSLVVVRYCLKKRLGRENATRNAEGIL